jgi:hypothetical protein
MCVGLMACASVEPQSVPDVGMMDPIFFLQYSVTAVHFELAPNSIRTRCRALRPWARLWIFAHFKNADGDYFIVNGLLKDGTLDSENDGFAIQIKGEECTVDGAGNIFHGNGEKDAKTYQSIRASQEVLHGLVEDMLQRYSLAFGGKARFLHALHQNKGFSSSNLFDSIREPFEEFAKTP